MKLVMKYLGNPANIYLFKVNNRKSRTMREIYSKFRSVFTTKLKILAFIQNFFRIKPDLRVRLGSQYTFKVNDKDTKTTSHMSFLYLCC